MHILFILWISWKRKKRVNSGSDVWIILKIEKELKKKITKNWYFNKIDNRTDNIMWVFLKIKVVI